ncbi:MAG: aldehyde dehydrogenase family protein [Myxococcales bacterium]|jgi:succinylglutamic semialdehyde dehydrogenase
MALPTLDSPGDFIGGRFVAPDRPDGELRVSSPADLDDLVSIHPHAQVHIERAVEAARAALPGWRRTTSTERRALLERYRDRVRAHREDIALCIAREVGKPLWEARGEVDAMAAKVDVMSGEGLEHTRDQRIEALPAEVRHRPLGVVAVIGPFNFPGHLPNGQIVPALLLGNTVVHKPSDKTPSTAVWIARCLHEAGLPSGVFNLVQGGPPGGQALTTHDDVDGILFTGSVPVGQAIVRDNAHRPDRLVALELGGKNATIALDDCDVEATARAVAFAAFVTAGQRCTATSRLLATPGVTDALVARIAEIARELRVGYPLDEGVFTGPVISEAARLKVLAAQQAARAGGFEPVVDGGPAPVPGHEGHYLRPAVHRAPSAATRVVGYSERELFGPDLAVYPVSDLDEAIFVANDTPFGLSAAVFTASEAAFEHAADGVHVGVLHWNRSSAGASGRLPFGGIKNSGNHRPAGIMAGTSCSYPLALLGDATPAAAADWPGFPS